MLFYKIIAVSALGLAKAVSFGDPVDEDDHNFVASIFIAAGRTPSCSGSFITPDVVLTAAHCVFEGTPFGIVEKQLRARVYFSGHLRVVVGVSQRSFAYSSHGSMSDDVALLFLSDAMEHVDPIPIESSSGVIPRECDRVSLLGFGAHVPSPSTLRVVDGMLRGALDTEVHSPAVCAVSLDYDDRSQFCFLRDRPQKACQGDSGGPIIIHDPIMNRNKLVGVLSYTSSSTCATGNSYAFRVALFAHWIGQSIVSHSMFPEYGYPLLHQSVADLAVQPVIRPIEQFISPIASRPQCSAYAAHLSASLPSLCGGPTNTLLQLLRHIYPGLFVSSFHLSSLVDGCNQLIACSSERIPWVRDWAYTRSPPCSGRVTGHRHYKTIRMCIQEVPELVYANQIKGMERWIFQKHLQAIRQPVCPGNILVPRV